MSKTELPLTSLDAALVRQVASGGRMSLNDAETLHAIANAIDAACEASEDRVVFLNKNATNPSLAAAEYATKRWAQFREEPRADVRDYIAFAFDDGWDAGKASQQSFGGCNHCGGDLSKCGDVSLSEQSEDRPNEFALRLVDALHKAWMGCDTESATNRRRMEEAFSRAFNRARNRAPKQADGDALRVAADRLLEIYGHGTPNEKIDEAVEAVYHAMYGERKSNA